MRLTDALKPLENAVTRKQALEKLRAGLPAPAKRRMLPRRKPAKPIGI